MKLTFLKTFPSNSKIPFDARMNLIDTIFSKASVKQTMHACSGASVVSDFLQLHGL